MEYAELLGQATVDVERPRSLDELATLLRADDDTTLLPVGGGTQLALGNLPVGPFRVVELRRALRGTIDHQADDLTIVVSAGVTIDAINEVTRQRGQRLSLDPPQPGRATIGGTLATGVAGPLAGRFGRPRDMVLGMTVMRPDGTLVKAGGRVVKNVTGYDLMRLWCGSLGTLGIMTEVALRVYPDIATQDLSWPVGSLEEGLAAIDALHRNDVRPEIADLLWRDGGWQLLVRLSEQAGITREALHPAADDADPAAYATTRDLGFGPGDALTLRCAATPRMQPQVAQAIVPLNPTAGVLRPLASMARWTWHADALPDAAALTQAIGGLRSALAATGGSVVIERAPAGWSDIDRWGPPPGSFFLMQRARAAWDPQRRINRGRYLGGL